MISASPVVEWDRPAIPSCPKDDLFVIAAIGRKASTIEPAARVFGLSKRIFRDAKWSRSSVSMLALPKRFRQLLT